MAENEAWSVHDYDDGTFNPHSDGTAPAKPAKAKKAAAPEPEPEAEEPSHRSAGGRAGHRA